MFRLKRLSNRPVLTPIENHSWERAAAFNTSVVYENGNFHLFYRASDKCFFLNSEKPDPDKKYISSIGHAISNDGINFIRYADPFLTGIGAQEAWGIEDPRVTKIDGTYYMVYAGFGGRDWYDVRVSMLSSQNLEKWDSHKVLLTDEPNKDAALLPRKINGKYFLFHRRMPSIWTAVSEDLTQWEDHQIIMNPRKGKWDCKKIGIGGPPLELKDGWLLIYHGVDDNHVYRLGAALLDKENPNKVIAVQDEPILEPELDWEVNGLVPNVVFSCGGCIVDNFLYVYYGAADTVIGVAGIEIDKITF